MLTAAGLAFAGLAVSAPAAAGDTTTVWLDKSSNSPQEPYQGYGTITVQTPENLDVAVGDTVGPLSFEVTCPNLDTERGYPSFRFELNGETVLYDGSWSQQTYTGILEFTVPDSADGSLDLRVLASGSCYSADGSDTDELLFSFAVASEPEPAACPAFPGSPPESEDVRKSAPDGAYETVWDVTSAGVLSEIDGYSGARNELQSGGWRGFMADVVVNDSDESITWLEECLSRDSATSTDWLGTKDDLGALSVTSRMTYYDADLARNVISITNESGQAMTDVPVSAWSSYDYETTTILDGAPGYGQVTADAVYEGVESQPVVTYLWGGRNLTIDVSAPFPAAELATSWEAAKTASQQWLDGASTISSDYFDDLEGTILNWGPDAIDVSANTEDGRVGVSLTIPELAAGATVQLVQFTRVVYWAPPAEVGVAPVWETDTLGELFVGTPVDADVFAEGEDVGYEIVDGTLPAGLSFNDGNIVGTPTTAGPYSVTIRATNQWGDSDQVFTGEVKAPALKLELQFAAGTRIEDAETFATAQGLQPGSGWTLTMFSDPIVIGSGVVAPSGILNELVKLPADTKPGAHRLLLTGIAPDGSTLTSQAWFTLDRNGVIRAVSLTGPTPELEALALTGASIGFSGALAAVLALLLGGALLVLGRMGKRS